jgi:hypothetical protein
MNAQMKGAAASSEDGLDSRPQGTKRARRNARSIAVVVSGRMAL